MLEFAFYSDVENICIIVSFQ